MNNLPISVIITTYNDTEYLTSAIESVLHQSYPPKQLIIVDDGSDSYMAKVVTNRYLDNTKGIDICFYRKDNGGASSARNMGLKYVNQPYLTFLDADDQLLKDSLLKRYNLLSNLSSEYFGVYGSAITSEGNNIDFINFDGSPNTSYVGKFHTGIPGGCYYYLFRTKYIKETGPFDISLTHNEDFDFIIRLLKAGKLCKGSVGSIYRVTIRPNSLSRNDNYEKTFNGLMTFLNKAEDQNYFTKHELKHRKQRAHLFLVKRILKRKPFLAFRHLLLAAKYI